MSNELEQLLLMPQRKLVVAVDEIDLSNNNENEVFVLMIEESSGSAGGRGGGSGHRKITDVIGFKIGHDKNKKIFETKNENLIEKFEIPYSAVAMDIKLSNGKEHVVQGLIDPVMIEDYKKII